MRLKLIISGFLLLLLISGCSMTDGALYSARGNIDAREYDDALINLTDANFSGFSKEQAPEVTFLKAKALYGLKRIDEAKAVLQFLIDKYPESKYPPQARVLLRKWKTK